MADAPVGGRNPETGTEQPAPPAESAAAPRIPVSEPPEVEPEGTGEGEGTDEDSAEDADGDVARSDGGDGEAGEPDADSSALETTVITPVVPQAPAAAEEPAPTAFDAFAPAARTDQAGKTGTPARSGSAPDPESAAKPQSAPESAPESAPTAGIDVSDAPASAAQPTESAEATESAEPGDEEKPARIPVSEPPDLEVEVAAEEAEAGEAPDGEPYDPDTYETVAVPPAVFDPDAVPGSAEAGADEDDEQSPPEPALLTPEADETTLIPKVAEHATESTTVMPSVASPRSDMARRPYTPAPAGYGSARQEWGGDDPGSPDAQPTRLQPSVPAATPAPPSEGRGYRPPEFRRVDPQRSQLPPPQNFKLDRREVEGEGRSGRRMGRRALLAGGGLAAAAVAGLAASGLLKLPGTAPKVPTVGFAPATNSGASSATQTGTAFLAAWQNGQLAAAANITDNPAAALAALQAYKKNLGVVGLVMNPNAANAVGWMTFAVTTQAGSPMGQWQYQSGFATYSKEIDGYTRWFVRWDPSILYTSLKEGYQLQIKKTPATIKGLVDRNNQLIDPAAHPSLAGVVNTLMKGATATGATDGQDIIMTDAKGNQLATVVTLTPPINNGTVATTLDMNVQKAAESAVTSHADSSLVVIQPSTGHILAFANNSGPQYYDEALETQVAPGSTFKIITSAALLSKGYTSLSSDVPCPAVISIDSLDLKNSEGESGDHTYEVDFATSCNNAFSSFWTTPGVGGDLLANTAKTYFGLNQKWDIGLGSPTQYMTVPTGLQRGDLAESLVGQGNIVATPLAMCSVAATVATGTFKQPILLPKQPQITATPLGADLQGKLKTLMGSVITAGGTAAGIFPDNGHFFGKTGTAEYGPRDNVKNNSWFVVFNDQYDIAVCARAIDGGYGAQTAAPQCLHVFQQLHYA